MCLFFIIQLSDRSGAQVAKDTPANPCVLNPSLELVSSIPILQAVASARGWASCPATPFRVGPKV